MTLVCGTTENLARAPPVGHPVSGSLDAPVDLPMSVFWSCLAVRGALAGSSVSEGRARACWPSAKLARAPPLGRPVAGTLDAPVDLPVSGFWSCLAAYGARGLLSVSGAGAGVLAAGNPRGRPRWRPRVDVRPFGRPLLQSSAQAASQVVSHSWFPRPREADGPRP